MMALQPGDIITAVNGIPVASGAAYQNAMGSLSSSGGRVRLTVRDVNSGLSRDWDTVAILDNNPGANNPNPNPGFDPNAPRKVHVVVAGQSGTGQAGFNSVVEVSFKDIDQMLTRIGDQFRGSVVKLSGAQCTAQGIMDAINNINAAPQDTIFFYYIGHGAQNAGQHYFQLNGTGGLDLPRADVAQALQQKNVRLAVMVSESCNQAGDVPVVAESRVRSEQSNTLTHLEHLLLGYRGYVDVNSTDDGQLGWGDSTTGGFFSHTFSYGVLSTSATTDWNTVISNVGEAANSKYQEKRQGAIAKGAAPQQMTNQTQMTPKIFALQVQADSYSVNPGQRTFNTEFRIFVPR